MGSESDKGVNRDDLLPLFRAEALQSDCKQWLGAIRLTQPIASWWVTTLATIFGTTLILYVLLGTITKKARVTGITVPIGGSISVAARTGGLLSKIFVKDGDRVSQGQSLFEISTAHQGAQGELTSLIASQLASRSDNLSSERRLRHTLAIEKSDALKRRIANLTSSIAQLDVEIALVKKRKNLAQASLKRFLTLQGNGFVSGAQTQQKQEELIDVQARISNLGQAKLQLKTDVASTESELTELSISHDVELAQLDSAMASLRQEITENQGRKSSLVVANEAGIVTTFTTQSGQEVSAGQTLATLTPVKNFRNFEVLLFAPSRTAGFIGIGQRVLIRYEAFPYQKYGLYRGEVVDVSETPFAPHELPGQIASTILSSARQHAVGGGAEGLYRIKVRLAHQSVYAQDGAHPLKAGMTLDADVVQEERKIWEWILQPLLSMSAAHI